MLLICVVTTAEPGELMPEPETNAYIQVLVRDGDT